MNRGRSFNKLSGGFSLGSIKNSLQIIKPIIEEVVHIADTVDRINKTIITPAVPIVKEVIRISNMSSKEPHKDPAHRLRKLALKAKKIMVDKKAKGGGTQHKSIKTSPKEIDELKNCLDKLPKNILTMVSHLHNGGMLIPILKIASHL